MFLNASLQTSSFPFLFHLNGNVRQKEQMSTETWNISVTAKSTASRYCPLLGFPFPASLQGFKTCLLRRCFHTLIKRASFPFPTDVGSHNPPPFKAQHPCWHTAQCPPPSGLSVPLVHCPMSGSNTNFNNPSPPLVDIVLFEFSLSAFPSKFLKRVC